ncbi:MAG: hypothetical protein ABEI06_03515 [Halobacteriaceae archaeon]
MSKDFTHRTHRAGGFMMILAGVIGAIVGLALLIGAATGGILGLTATTEAIIGGVVLVFSVIEFVGGWSAYKGKNWYGSMTAAVLGIVTFFTFPLDLLGAILVALGEGRFDHEE